MGRDRDRDGSVLGEEEVELDRKDDKIISKSKARDDLESDSEREGKKRKGRRSDKRRGGRRRKRSRSRGSEDGDSESESSESESESDYSDSEDSESEIDSQSDDQDERRRRKRKERKRREREEREKKRRKKDKERKRKRKEKEREEERRRKKKKEKKLKKKEKLEKGKKGAVTDSWGKYGVIRETDMWNKRPEFTAWLAEVKQINLESLPNWEEKQMFKQFMEDHNTATFPSKKYYDLDTYYRRKMEKEMKKGVKKAVDTERIIFNDEEQRRLELLAQREKEKEKEVETLKRAMQSGMAQAMKEQAQLREEMAYQYKLGNFEAAAAIQKRLDPDVAM